MLQRCQLWRGPFPQNTSSPVGSQGPQWGTDRGLQEIQKRVRGIRESFLEVVAFEMSLGEQVGFSQEVLRCEHLWDASRLVQEAEGSWPGPAPATPIASY